MSNKKILAITVFLAFTLLLFAVPVNCETYLDFPSTAATNETVEFSYIGIVDPQSYLLPRYSWSFGDENTTSTETETITHAYTTAGVYNVTFNLYAVPNLGDEWSVSPEWEQLIYSESAQITVSTPTPTATATPAHTFTANDTEANLVGALVLWGTVPFAICGSVIIIIVKKVGSEGGNINPSLIGVAIVVTLVITLVIELCVVILSMIANAL